MSRKQSQANQDTRAILYKGLSALTDAEHALRDSSQRHRSVCGLMPQLGGPCWDRKEHLLLNGALDGEEWERRRDEGLCFTAPAQGGARSN